LDVHAASNPSDSAAASSAPPPSRLRADVVWCALAVIFGVFLRVVGAHERSYWVDELHSIGHGLRPTVDAAADSVQRDFHAPLFFFTVQEFFAHRLGDGPHAPRALTILANLLALVPIGLLAARIGGRRCGLLAIGVAALLPFQIHYAIELRPYASVMTCAALAGWAAFDDRSPMIARLLVFAAATALGVLTQFLMIVAVASIGIARVFLWVANRRRPTPPPDAAGRRLLPLWTLIVAGALGGAALRPWIETRMTWIAEEGAAELAPDDGPSSLVDTLTPAMLKATAQKPLQVLIPRIGALGTPFTETVVAAGAFGAAIVALAAIAVLIRLARRRASDDGAPTDGARLAIALGVLAFAAWASLSWAQVYSWKRVVLRYDVVWAWVAPILLACVVAAAPGRFGAVLRRLLLVAVAFLGVGETFGAPFEELRPAVRVALETGARLDVDDPSRPPLFTSLLWQPRFFDPVLPFRVYAPDAAFRAPDLLPRPGDPEFSRPVVAVVHRYERIDDPKADFGDDATVAGLRRGRKAVRSYRIDDRVRVVVFAPEK
jgi:hypothetical protein